MAKTITLRLDNRVYRLFLALARAQHRSLSNYIEVSALQYATQSEFAEESEMNEIFSDKGLIKRLKEGSRQVRAMKGKFIG